MQSSWNFCGFYAVILQILWFLCSHPAFSMVSTQSSCNFYGFYAVILSFLWFLRSHPVIYTVPMESSCLDLPTAVPVCSDQAISVFPEQPSALHYSVCVLWWLRQERDNEVKLQQVRLKHLRRWLWYPPPTQVTSMQTRVKQISMCLYTRAVAEVSLQLSERQAHGACTVVTCVELINTD